MSEPRPVAVPSLDALAADAMKAAGLPPDVRQVLTLRAAAVIAALAAAPVTDTNGARAPEDRALGIEEAAGVLRMTEDSLYRKWKTLGIGYKDADGRVKFSAAALQRYIARRTGKTA